MLDKKAILNACLEFVNKKINMLNQAIELAQTSSNNETKSSAGDKHETSRAMAQIEKDRLAKQLLKQIQLKEALLKIPVVIQEKVTLGSFVKTSGGDFFISVGLGKITIEEEFCFAIPIHSPVGKELSGKSEGDNFIFNGQSQLIINIK